MDKLKKRKFKIADKIAIGVLVIYCIAMFFVFNYEKIIYKNYKNIHADIDSDMPGYEIPIAKNVELANNRVSDWIAYAKYNCTPDEYSIKVKELEGDKEEAKKDETYYSEELERMGLRCWLSYDIYKAEQIEIEEADRDAGITNMYDVKFVIMLLNGSEVKDDRIYSRRIAEVDGLWIFYDESFSVPRNFLYEEPIE